MLDAGGARACRHRADGRGGGAALRALSLGALRRDRAAAELPLWRHGKSDADLPHADLHRRRQEPRRAGRARAGAQLVGQSRHQRDLVRLLAERGLHLLFREPDHGGALRAAPGGAGSGLVVRRHGDAPSPKRVATRPPPGCTAATIPTAGVGGIVYDKGAAFLRTLERIVGRERWDAYLRSYFDRHAFQPMTSERFLADLRANLVRGRRGSGAAADARSMGLSARPARQCGAARSGGVRGRRPGARRLQ